jgi:hypothetical protein
VRREKGVIIVDTPGYDISSVTGKVAGGARLVLFTTGKGTPTGSPAAPVIKISSNNRTSRHLGEDIDMTAGDSVGLLNVGIMLDSVHMMVEGEDILASMRASGSHFWHFHVSDSDRLPVGQGSYDIKEFMDALRATEFQRYVTVETLQIPDGVQAIQESFDSLRPYFN